MKKKNEIELLCLVPSCSKPLGANATLRQFYCNHSCARKGRRLGLRVAGTRRPGVLNQWEEQCSSCGKICRAPSTLCKRCYGVSQRGRSKFANPLEGDFRTRTDRNGYIRMYLPTDGTPNGGKQVMQHRWLMEQHLGRRLFPDESVHHVNGVRDDNRLENLEIWVKPQPTGIRSADAVVWAKEIIRRYEAN